MSRSLPGVSLVRISLTCSGYTRSLTDEISVHADIAAIDRSRELIDCQ